MRKIIRTIFKFIALLIGVFICLYPIQRTLHPNYFSDVTNIVDGFYDLEPDTVDVLFAGASQMFCTVDAETLTRDYGISSYDFGGSAQVLPVSAYYINEALKTQHPKVIAVEICMLFIKNQDIEDNAFTWFYDPMPLTLDKVISAFEILPPHKAIQYTFLPIIRTHSRWATVQSWDISHNWGQWDYACPTRGFLPHQEATSVDILYKSEYEGEIKEIPCEVKNSLLNLASMCRERGVRLLFFKAPVANWSRGESVAAKAFMEENGLEYLEMNDYLDEMGIDSKTDFFNDAHLNASGAAKATIFLAEYIKPMLE